ncbi:hypothetical protein EAX61_04405 [Dokdonia sinensis]|uniref:2TM domain-containing protein n=1 Tax=Dokdonia sinensis TaxID=2479847 RepID=A0A3M0GEV9_9FLAO|nr:2TM domain-containing protein [Dokdonia sinensis]RMB62828.1 hypothetical protein EAX61_04405 [Dokdonia sinensis]
MGLFTKKKETAIDPEQRELIENAQARVRQKKNLYRHFVVFLAGAILLIVLNLALGIGEEFKPFEKPWFVWAILIWIFFFLVHLINVFLLGSFMNKKWEKEQVDKLVQKQKAKIAQIQQQIDAQNPLPEKKSPLLTYPEKPFTDQNSPL